MITILYRKWPMYWKHCVYFSIEIVIHSQCSFCFKPVSRKPRAIWILCSNNACHSHAYHPITDRVFDTDTDLRFGCVNCTAVLWWIVAWFLRNGLCPNVKLQPCDWLRMLSLHKLASLSSLCYICDVCFADPNRNMPWGFAFN